MSKEQKYVLKRIWKARMESIPFYLCRLFRICKRKIVFCCIEGTTGYSCNPKYIAEELLRTNQENKKNEEAFELVWLVNDMTHKFPAGIRVVHNTLWKRAYHLTTARVWIDNSRKQLEVRKRKGQLYIQTWHAKLGFKPTCLDRGESFSRIAYLVSKHDSEMIDYVLSNSKWYDDTLPTGMLYDGPVLRTGSPRCDILVKARNDTTYKAKLRARMMELSGMEWQTEKAAPVRFLMYAPTFRGGSQRTRREVEAGSSFSAFGRLMDSLKKKFGGEWIILLRLHPQLVAGRQGRADAGGKNVVDVSRVDDMYELLAGCDAFMTDYSSAAFDAAVMKIPVFLYCDDYRAYEAERGRLLWDLEKLPFPLALNEEELEDRILGFHEEEYRAGLQELFERVEMLEDGKAAERVAEFLGRIGRAD
ncbi:MAG: hypothetical protein HFI91_02430 [Lachnospiraceae bacterium]|nr:hypothetical protein [Lachnospiraceae bacterium]